MLLNSGFYISDVRMLVKELGLEVLLVNVFVSDVIRVITFWPLWRVVGR